MLKWPLRWLLKHSRSFLAWSCFALALAVMAWIGSLSPSYQKCAAEHERHYGNNEEQRDRNQEFALHAGLPRVGKKDAGVTA